MRPLQVDSFYPKVFAVDENRGSGVLGCILGNPIYIACILTVIVLLLISYVLSYKSISSKNYLKLFVYILTSSCFFLSIHHSIHVDELARQYKKSGIQDVYNSIDSIRSTNVLPSYPVPVNASALPLTPAVLPPASGAFELPRFEADGGDDDDDSFGEEQSHQSHEELDPPLYMTPGPPPIERVDLTVRE